MMKKRLTQAFLTMVVLAPFAVMARAVPASSGRPAVWADGACFLMTYSTMYNGCTARKSFEFPLPVDTVGNKTAYVAAQGASSANSVGCAEVGMNREGTLVYGGARKWLTSFGTPQIITLTDAYIPAGGYLYVNCSVDPSAFVISIDYNA
ncbi:hypothetical protein LZ198_14305 [Myxococcus sp. K15C18031901]|uniref:hypothetical protein n=1 Tax=Myxococcus dinghuensis TaxID=2906761 RepID=UPI0020A81BE8|nr:hypothetical protein [Myxococcus dinghuensis]MCP3100045.1 hypothetical protein [Myxococcus dinghuensis]